MTCMVVAEAEQLFDSLISMTFGARLSAHARRKYVPGVVSLGIVTVTLPLEILPGSSAGTARVPVRRLSPPPRLVLIDRKYRVVVGGTAPSPRFVIRSVTRKLAPATAVAGGFVTLSSSRSGRPVTSIVLPEAAQLFLSLLSLIFGATSSAHARTRYVPTAVLVGILTVTVPIDVSPGCNAGTARVPTRRLSPVLFRLLNDR